MGTPLTLKTGGLSAEHDMLHLEGQECNSDGAIADREEFASESKHVSPTPATPKGRGPQLLRKKVFLEADRSWSALESDEAHEEVLDGLAAIREQVSDEAEWLDKRVRDAISIFRTTSL